MKQLSIILMMLLTVCSAQAAQKTQRQKLPVTRVVLTPRTAVLGAVAIGAGYAAYRVLQKCAAEKQAAQCRNMLWHSAHVGDANGVAEAILYGADVNLPDEKKGLPPLWHAVIGERWYKFDSHGYTKVVQLLLEADAQVGIRIDADRTGSYPKPNYTEVEFAKYYGCNNCLKAIEEFEKLGKKHTAQQNDTKQAEAPIETQKDGKQAKHVHFPREIEEDDYQLMLWNGAFQGDLYDVSTAIQHGAKVNVLDEGGHTPLYLAALGRYKKGSYTEVVNLLLETGALLDMKAEEVAREGNQEEIVKIFEQHREKLAKQQAEKEAENKPKCNVLEEVD